MCIYNEYSKAIYACNSGDSYIQLAMAENRFR
jgi:hypothetical protein